MDFGVSDGLTVGAVMMVVQRDKVLALEAAGYSDLDTKRPMRTDAIFDIPLDKQTDHGLWSAASGGRRKARTGRSAGQVLARVLASPSQGANTTNRCSDYDPPVDDAHLRHGCGEAAGIGEHHPNLRSHLLKLWLW